MGSLTTVLGPARSGKSRWAEHLAGLEAGQVVYLATGPGEDSDTSWRLRLERHRLRRPNAWQCWEVGSALAPALDRLEEGQLGLVDSLGSWVAHGLDLEESDWRQACDQLLVAVKRCRAGLVVVSEQTGWGVVPATAIGGLFRDRLGLLERSLVQGSNQCWLVVAGRAIDLHRLGQVVPEDA